MVTRLLALLLAATLVAGCAPGGKAGSSTQPDSGVIWFGASIDPQTLVLSGRASTFARGAPVAFLAHLTRLTTATDNLGLFLIGGGSLTGEGLLDQPPAGSSLVGQFLTPSDIGSPGTYAVAITDADGNHLADGSFTVSP